MSTLHQQLLHHLPFADPLVTVTSTITSSDVFLVNIRPTDKGIVVFSSIEYPKWLNDSTASVEQLLSNTIW